MKGASEWFSIAYTYFSCDNDSVATCCAMTGGVDRMFMVTLRLDRAVGGVMNTESVREGYNLYQASSFVLDMGDKLVGIGQSAEETKRWVLGVYRKQLRDNSDGLTEGEIQQCIDAIEEVEEGVFEEADHFTF